jgi:hopanoid biosynthesis associated protein HpnK
MPRRLIVNADDFGLNPSANAAIIRAHQGGILTTASLMVNEPGFDEAVALARANPSLGVGLHLTLLCGHAALPRQQIPGLLDASCSCSCSSSPPDPAPQFTNNPTAAGFRYFFHRSLREQLRAEIHAQFKKFQATGLILDHINGHLHLHLHPTVFSILMQDAAQLGVERMRLTRDPFRLNLRLASGRLGYRALHAAIFGWLAARARPVLRRRGIRHTQAVFGLLQNALVDEEFVGALLPRLPAGDSELYSHPSLDEFKHELDALTSPRVKAQVAQLGIQLIRYQDL